MKLLLDHLAALRWTVLLPLSLLLSAASLAHCAVGPDYCGVSGPPLPGRYQTPLRETASYLPGQFHCQASCSPRLVLFPDPVLNALITRAEQQNLSLCEAYQRIIEARAWTHVANGSFFPQADATADYAFTKRSRVSGTSLGTSNGAFDLFSLGFDSSWEIDLFGKLRRQVELSEAKLAEQEENYQDVRLTLLTDVASVYVRVRVLQHQLQVARKNILQQQKTLKLIEELEEAGKSSALDVAQGRSLTYSTLSEIPELEQELQIALNQLSLLMGEAPGPGTRSFLGRGSIPVPPRLAGLGVPADLVRRRPDIRSAEQEVIAASARIGIATADLYPQLTLLGTISVESRNLSSLFTGDSVAASLGPSLRWNILNFWRISSSIEAYEAQYAQAVTRYRLAVLKAVQEVEDGLSNYHWGQAKLAALEKTTLANADAVKLSLSRYKAGKAGYQRVLDSQEQMLIDEQKLAISRGILALELIRISKAVGGGWCESTISTQCNSRRSSPLFPSPPAPTSPSLAAPNLAPPHGEQDAFLPPDSEDIPNLPLRGDEEKGDAEPKGDADTPADTSDSVWRLPSFRGWQQARRSERSHGINYVASGQVASEHNPSLLAASHSAPPKPWWRNIAISLLSLIVVGLSLLWLIAIRAHRRKAV